IPLHEMQGTFFFFFFTPDLLAAVPYGVHVSHLLIYLLVRERAPLRLYCRSPHRPVLGPVSSKQASHLHSPLRCCPFLVFHV
ncbi:hypothetical protein V8C40DRAFT_243560, partial [Trichoderma camerunense]